MSVDEKDTIVCGKCKKIVNIWGDDGGDACVFGCEHFDNLCAECWIKHCGQAHKENVAPLVHQMQKEFKKLKGTEVL